MTTDGADTLIKIPHVSAGFGRYLAALFMLAWLGVWPFGWLIGAGFLAGGWRSAAETLASGSPRSVGAIGITAFAAFWLLGWTLAGIRVMHSAYRALRHSAAETLRLTTYGVAYDSGVPPPANSKSLFERAPKQTRMEIDRQKLETLRLRKTDMGNRLTVDADRLRLDIGQGVSEIEASGCISC